MIGGRGEEEEEEESDASGLAKGSSVRPCQCCMHGHHDFATGCPQRKGRTDSESKYCIVRYWYYVLGKRLDSIDYYARASDWYVLHGKRRWERASQPECART